MQPKLTVAQRVAHALARVDWSGDNVGVDTVAALVGADRESVELCLNELANAICLDGGMVRIVNRDLLNVEPFVGSMPSAPGFQALSFDNASRLLSRQIQSQDLSPSLLRNNIDDLASLEECRAQLIALKRDTLLRAGYHCEIESPGCMGVAPYPVPDDWRRPFNAMTCKAACRVCYRNRMQWNTTQGVRNTQRTPAILRATTKPKRFVPQLNRSNYLTTERTQR